jgi:transcriptional regulator with XRE-family HTH domain
MQLNLCLKNLRESKGYTPISFASRLGIERETLDAYESGTEIPGLQCLINIADILEVSLDTLCGHDICHKSLGEVARSIITLAQTCEIKAVGGGKLEIQIDPEIVSFVKTYIESRSQGCSQTSLNNWLAERFHTFDTKEKK